MATVVVNSLWFIPVTLASLLSHLLILPSLRSPEIFFCSGQFLVLGRGLATQLVFLGAFHKSHFRTALPWMARFAAVVDASPSPHYCSDKLELLSHKRYHGHFMYRGA